MSRTINQLTAVTSLSAGDNIAVYVSGQGDARKASMTTLSAYIQSVLETDIPAYVTQYAAPSATGFTVSITDNSNNTHLILTPVAGYAAGTIKLPAISNAIDKQTVLVNCTQSVTALTIDGNSAVAVTGAPTALAANDFFTLKLDKTTQTWYRVG